MKNLLADENGSATILAVGILSAIASVFLVLVAAGTHCVHAHHAQVVADVSAIGGAYALYEGKDGCTRSRAVALRNRAQLTGCRVEGGDVVVTAEVGRVEREARAGPLA